MQSFLDYSYLWAEDREKQIEKFCDTSPLTIEISEKFQEFEDRAEAIKQLPNENNVGAVAIIMGEWEIFTLFYFKCQRLGVLEKHDTCGAKCDRLHSQ